MRRQWRWRVTDNGVEASRIARGNSTPFLFFWSAN
jgi:hypothetical protein